MACHQDTNSVEQVVDATEEFLWLEREAKEAREDTGLKELVIQTLEEEKNRGIQTWELRVR